MDLAEGMIEQASRLDARIPFSVGDMLCLPVQNDAWLASPRFTAFAIFRKNRRARLSPKCTVSCSRTGWR
jgi:hypothetical protein